MLSSPFQQPSRRQNALALQIQEARTTGDEALLSRLISQWVHRYGFNGSAELDLNLPEVTVPELTVPERAFSSAGLAGEPFCAPESVAEENEVVMQDEVEAEDEVLVENQDVEAAVAEDEMAVEDEASVEEEVVAEETALQQSFNAGPVPAPPISTPRSLRRWLPRRADDAFPKAS